MLTAAVTGWAAPVCASVSVPMCMVSIPDGEYAGVHGVCLCKWLVYMVSVPVYKVSLLMCSVPV